MKAIAEFAMRGRPHAIGLALVAACLPPLQWLASAVVSLVILRRGIGEGAFVALWASLPLVTLFVMTEDPSSLVLMLATIGLAFILRATFSWEMTILAAVVIAAISGLLIELLSPQIIDLFVQVIDRFLTDLQTEAVKSGQIANDEVRQFSSEALHNLWFGFMVSGYAMASLLFLVLARWWQSELYNPGGFGTEFKALRLSPIVVSVIALAIVVIFVLGVESRWYLLFMVPLLAAAIGFVHWYIAEKEMSGGWLVSFYLLLIFMNQITLPLIATLALLDSWFNLRNRIRSDREE